MFRCQLSGKVSKPGEKGIKIVTKTRKKNYFKLDEKTNELVKVSEGWEIVQEKLVLKSEAEKYYARSKND